jgi:hypothetical protein
MLLELAFSNKCHQHDVTCNGGGGVGTDESRPTRKKMDRDSRRVRCIAVKAAFPLLSHKAPQG